ncbi:MAG: hypothetical protein ABIP38_11755, partial [Steroidobacteraceae bacterium]
MPSAGKSRSSGDQQSGSWPARTRSLGIVPRLVFSFIAVTVLAVAANLIAEHGVSVIETKELARVPSSPVPVASTVAAAPVAKVIPISPVSFGQAATLLPAFERLDRAMLGRLELDDAGGRLELERALKDLQQRASAFPWEMRVPGQARSRKASELVQAFVHQGMEAVGFADERRARDADYRERLAALDATLAEAIDKGWKVFGRIFAKQSLINLSRNLRAIESASVALSAANYHDAAFVDALRASEVAFAIELRKGRENLRRSQGEPWLIQFDSGFDALAALRVAAITADQNMRGAVTQLDRERPLFTSLVKTALDSAAAGQSSTAGPQPKELPESPVATAFSPSTPEAGVETRVVSRIAAPADERSRT